ncbi:MAG: alpha/beta hydrolase [Gemmatimonadetes bacterium]|nr:alpha/beta hydrolase [Gemmatimonadota bacterium]
MHLTLPALLAAALTTLPALAQEPPAPQPRSGLRAQTPVPPFPYTVEERTVEGQGARLACTLTRPMDAAAAPGAVLLTVAGPNDRDQTHSGHKPFLVLADHLTRQGMATLRCDDRGVGGSSGSLTDSSLEDLALDARAMVAALAREPGVGAVGVIGNSEGSVVGALAAAAAPEAVSFVVLLGGVGVEGAAVIGARLESQARQAGVPADVVGPALARFDSLVAIVREVGGVGIEALRRERPELLARLSAMAQEAGRGDPFLPQDPAARTALFAGPWYHDQVTLDGGAVLERVRVPVLALTGSRDRTNLPAQNLPAIAAALERGGNPDFQVTELSGLNHVFQTARVGGMAEYATLEETFSPRALRAISRWIGDRFGGAGGRAAGRSPGVDR